MKHAIDPKVDCVFKAIFGSEVNLNLLVHFLNAALHEELSAPIVEVTLLNPNLEKNRLDGKRVVLDVKARDAHGRIFQIEIQMVAYPSLPLRMIYNWARVYADQLEEGEDYTELRPTYSIWLVNGNVTRRAGAVHRYRFRDDEGHSLAEAVGGIFVFELLKLIVGEEVSVLEGWLLFFRDGERLCLGPLPVWMQIPEMEQAMKTLREFSEKEHRYEEYRARLDYLRQEATIRRDLEAEVAGREWERQRAEAALEREAAALQREVAAQREKEVAQREKEAALQREEAAQRSEQQMALELERLKALLHKGSQN